MADNAVPSGTFGDYSPSNADATTEPSHYEICQRSGFRVKAGELVKEWTGLYVRPQDWEPRHPQDFVRPVVERHRDTISPEPDDVFLSTNEITAGDL